MAKSIDEIANAVMGMLYQFIASATAAPGDSGNQPFISWCKPGVPFLEEDFRFAKYMLNGQGATEDERIADVAFQMTQAAGFSRFVDFVPSVNGLVGGKIDSGGVLRPGSASLSTVYGHILEASQVADLPDPPGTAEKIAAIGQKAAALRDNYSKYSADYQSANGEYVMAALKARYSAAAKLEFAAKGGALKSKRDAAWQDWELLGSKSQYESLTGQLQSLMSTRKPALWLKEALDRFRDLPQGMDATFGEARITMPYPGGFASSNRGWTTVDITSSHVDGMTSSKSTKWEASGGFGWGSLKLGASASGSTDEKLSVSNTNNFSLKLSIAQVPLLRNWFDPWYLKSAYWRFKDGTIEASNKDVVSDGGSPPKGLLIGYPVTAIFIRDVVIGMDELKDESSELTKMLKAEGHGGWGFGVINVGGKYERNSTETKQAHDVSNGKVTIEGLQLGGFLVETVGISPCPKADLAWVGAA
jgi:hypothetical protein